MSQLDKTLVDAVNLEYAGVFTSKTSKALASLMGYGEQTKDLSITNLTKLDIPCTYGKYVIDIFRFIPPVVSYGKNIIGIATLGSDTTITLHTYEDNDISLQELLRGIR